MEESLSKDELVQLVEKIINNEGTDEEIDNWVVIVERSVPMPGITNLIYYSHEKLTAEEVVERALAYRPIQLPPST